MNTTLIPRSTKPRNPAVAAALFRKAGLHRRSPGGQRQQAERAMQREYQAATSAWPHPSP